jgi:putative ATP-binding cassette transporter
MVLFSLYSFDKTRVQLKSELEKAERSEFAFSSAVQDFIMGIRELERSSKRMDAFLEDAKKIISEASTNRIKSSAVEADFVVMNSSLSLLFAGAIVFLLPILSAHTSNELAKITAVSLFVLGPSLSIVNGTQQWFRAQFSIRQISIFLANNNLNLEFTFNF